MTRIMTILALLAILLLPSCGSPDFSLSFTLPDSVNANYRIIYHAASRTQSVTIDLVAPIQKGAGKLKCPAVKPTVVWICSSSGEPILALFAERGDDIKISGDSTDPLAWEISGNTVNKDWSAWRKENLGTLRSGIPERINAAVAGYVSDHPDDRLSLLLLLTTYSRATDPDGFRRLWKNLSDDARDQSLIDAVGRADILSPSPRTAAELPPLPLLSVSGLPDTIRPAASRATIIYLWHADSQRRREHMDSLRSLARQFPDSAARTIADICLDPDSLSWAMPLRSDSLVHTLRGWLPAGEAHPILANLGIPRTPLFIVASSDSRILYLGNDAARATSAFRSRLNKK